MRRGVKLKESTELLIVTVSDEFFVFYAVIEFEFKP